MSELPPPSDTLPMDAEALLARAEACLGERAFEAALAAYQAAGALLGEDDPRVELGLNLTRLSMQQEARATRGARKLKSNPTDVESALQVADARRRVGKFAKALEVLEAIAQQAPDDARVHHELGLTVLSWRQDPAGSLPHFDRALALQPDLVPALIYRAIARRDAGQHDGAIDDFARLEALTPGDRVIHENRAFVYLALKDHANAEADFDRVLAIDPDNLFYLTHRGQCRLALGRHEAAIADFTRALALRQARAMTYYDPARDAKEPYDPDPEALKGRGLAHLALGDVAAARADLEKAAEAYRMAKRIPAAEGVEAQLADLPPGA